jgi:hypothetical protein
VRDHGPGLPAGVIPHVFDRFYKADTARARSEGSGLGLAIAWENAQLYGGQIEAGNHPGGGAVFTVYLPLNGDPRQRMGHRHPPTGLGGRARRRRRVRPRHARRAHATHASALVAVNRRGRTHRAGSPVGSGRAGYGTKIMPLGVIGPVTVSELTAPVVRLIVPM